MLSLLYLWSQKRGIKKSIGKKLQRVCEFQSEAGVGNRRGVAVTATLLSAVLLDQGWIHSPHSLL